MGNISQLKNGQIVSIRSREENPDFLHILSRRGAYERSFGGSRVRQGCSGCSTRIVIDGNAAGEFLAIPQNDFEVETWNTAGNLGKSIKIASAWFPASRVELSSPANLPPPPRITGGALDARGILWVSGYSANSNWKPITNGVVRVGRTSVVPLTSRSGAVPPLDYTGITGALEAIDLSTGAVLATARYEGEMMGMLPGGYAFTRRQDSDGIVRLDIWKLELKRPE